VLALLAFTAAQILMNLPEDVAVDSGSEAAVESIRAGVVRDHDARRAP
jgi:hypothetical protein